MESLFSSPGNIHGNKYWGFEEITLEDIRKHDEWWAKGSMNEDEHDKYKYWCEKNYHPVYLTEEFLLDNGFYIEERIDEGVSLTILYKIQNPRSDFQKAFKIEEYRWYEETELNCFSYLLNKEYMDVYQPEFLHVLQVVFRYEDGQDFFSVTELNDKYKELTSEANETGDDDFSF